MFVKREEHKSEAQKIISQLPHFQCPNFPAPIPYLIDWCNTLKIEDRLTDQELDNILEKPSYCNICSEGNKCLLSLIAKNREYLCHGVWGIEQTNLNDKWQVRLAYGQADFYYDIRVIGLAPNSYSSAKLVTICGANGQDITICKGVWNPTTQEVQFPDFTKNNPLILNRCGADIKIEFQDKNPLIDPKQITVICKNVFLDGVSRQVFKDNHCSISKVQSENKYLISHHFASTIVDLNEVEFVYSNGLLWQRNDEEGEFEDCDDLEHMTVQI